MSKPETILFNIRHYDGSIMKAEFPLPMTLKMVGNYVKKKGRELGLHKSSRGYLYKKGKGFKFLFTTQHPKKEYDPDIEKKTIGELFKGEKKVIFFIKAKEETVVVERGFGSIEDGKISDSRAIRDGLEGFDYESKVKFEEKMKARELAKKLAEAEKKKLDLEKVRVRIEEDKLNRVEKVWVKPEKNEETTTTNPTYETGAEPQKLVKDGESKDEHGYMYE